MARFPAALVQLQRTKLENTCVPKWSRPVHFHSCLQDIFEFIAVCYTVSSPKKLFNDTAM